MNKLFQQTVSNHLTFDVYKLGMVMLVKSMFVLARRGADPKAISFIKAGIDKLVVQLNAAGDELDRRAMVEDVLKNLRNGGKEL